MKSRPVATHLDDTMMARLHDIAATENRPPSRIIEVALKMFLDQSPGARRAMFAIEGVADTAERDFAAGLVGRSLLKAYESIIDHRQERDYHPSGNRALDTEEAIEAEAVRMCAK